MKDERVTITDKETLKITINAVEMREMPNMALDIDLLRDGEDELERKSRLLDQRMKVLERTTVQTWRRLFPVFNIIAVLSLSGMQLGYGICEITTVYDQVSLLATYNFNPPIGLGIGSMVAFMPFGAIFGSIFNRCFGPIISLKYPHPYPEWLTMLTTSSSWSPPLLLCRLTTRLQSSQAASSTAGALLAPASGLPGTSRIWPLSTSRTSRDRSIQFGSWGL
jgi:hypothetical protein